ncbi:MAG: energy transducer TonB [Saprospiraceae bacterium]|nr:energy transducer TonB [Saprospiraceae bacterium]
MKFIILIALLSIVAIGHANAQEDSTHVKPVERLPSFPGGIEEMYKFIYSELRCPADAKRFKITDQVITQFEVNAEGHIEEIKVTSSIGYGCEEEAIRVITVM